MFYKYQLICNKSYLDTPQTVEFESYSFRAIKEYKAKLFKDYMAFINSMAPQKVLEYEFNKTYKIVKIKIEFPRKNGEVRI